MRRLRTFCLCFFLLLLAISFAYGEQTEIPILHVNDFHGFVEPCKPLGSEELLGGIAYRSRRHGLVEEFPLRWKDLYR